MRQTSSAVVPSQNSVSLYTDNDKVIILTSQNFSLTVYESNTAWLIEFYASWCGHCQSYANTYREVAIDTWGWKTVVRIGAINCYADENSALCEQHKIESYPTLRFIEPQTTMNASKTITITATDAKGVEKELIKKLVDVNRIEKSWPQFIPASRASFDDLFNRAPPSVKLLLLIIEKRDDFTGSQIMLDFSKYYEQLAIFRTTTDKKLWYRFQINITDIPALFAILPNRTIEKINTKQENTNENIGSRNLFNYAIRSYIRQRKYIVNFDDRDLEEIILSRNALKNAETKLISYKKNAQINLPVDNIIINQKISMIDFETALSYMFRREIPRIQEIRGEAYDALIHWLVVLIKYFPGREPVMNYLKQLLSAVKEQSNGLTGKQFRELADLNTTSSYLPNNNFQYKYCAGSSPTHRGYPCGLWILFHTLTVSQVQTELVQINTIEILSAIKKFLKYFFGCRHCSENFMKETKDINQLDSNNKYAAVIYLWEIHNRVNKRLHGDITEDLQHPKIQFPPKSLCSNCHLTNKNSDSDFDESTILKFLLRYFSKENIDLSLVENLAILDDNKQNRIPRNGHQTLIDQYTMIEITNEPKNNVGFIRSLISIFQNSKKKTATTKYDQEKYVIRSLLPHDNDMLEKLSRRAIRYTKRAIMGAAFFFTDEQEINRRSSVAGASYNLINSIVGSGVIGMSYSFRQSGYLAGILLLVMVAILTDYSTTILLRSGQMAKATTYQELVYNVLGKFGFLWLSLVQFLYPFICLISYNIIIGDTVTKVLHRLWPTIPYLFQNRYIIIFLCSCFVTLPLSLYRNIAKLSQVSLTGLILVLTTVLILIKRGYDTMPFISSGTRDIRVWNSNIAESIGVMAFAFMCQHNSFLIYHSMNDKTLSRWRIVTSLTATIAFVFAAAYALTGYIVFGQQTEGDLLENYCHWDTLINIARLIYAINIMLTFPLECLVCRQVIEIVCSKWTSFSSDRNHYIITILIVIASVILSLSTDCLGIVLELNGLLVASSLAYILPALCYLKLKPRSTEFSFDNICSYILLIIGILLTISGFVLPLRHALQEGYYCQHGIEPRYCTRMFPTAINHTKIKLRIKSSS
ncbi:unnamed protein product [Rotaria socialis]